jgi:predicted amidophosphoribosyltransferase
MVEPLDLQVNLAQQAEVGRMQQAGTQQAAALHQHIAAKLEAQTEHAQTSVQTTQPPEEQRIERRKNNNRNPFWWKRQRKKKETNIIHDEKTKETPHPIKGKIIDVWR